MRGKKKGIALSMNQLIWILFLLIAFILIVGLVNMFFGKAEGKIAEDICRADIALRVKTTIKVGTAEIKTTPFLCKTLDKEITNEKELADLIAKCWWMMGEGLLENVYGTDWFFGKQKCFTCYTIKIKDDLSIDSENFKKSYLAETVYKVREETDNCKLFGGWCVENEADCKELSEERGYDWDTGYFKADDDTKCKKEKEKKICCYSPYNCLNKGGECLSQPKEDYLKYELWNCPFRECYIKKGNYWTYLDYVQEYGGKGKIAFEPENLEINKDDIYAVGFVSITKNDLWLDKEPWKEDDINFILISKLNKVNEYCDQQLGVG